MQSLSRAFKKVHTFAFKLAGQLWLLGPAVKGIGKFAPLRNQRKPILWFLIIWYDRFLHVLHVHYIEQKESRNLVLRLL